MIFTLVSRVPRMAFVMTAVIVLTACQKEPPSCTASETLGRVKQNLREELLPSKYRGIPVAVFDRRVDLVQPLPTAYDKAIGKFDCEAQLVVDSSAGTGGEDPQAVVGFESSGDTARDWSCEGESGRCRSRIEFSSQQVEGQHVVRARLAPEIAALTGLYVAQHAPKKRKAPAGPVQKPAKPEESERAPGELSLEFEACEGEANTAAERDACLGEEISRQYAALSLAYKEAQQRLGSAEERETLEQEQERWEDEREQQCREEADLPSREGLLCLAEKATLRADELARR